MIEALQKTNGNVSLAAKLLNVPRSTFYKRMQNISYKVDFCNLLFFVGSCSVGMCAYGEIIEQLEINFRKGTYVKYIEIGFGNRWFVRTETENKDGTEFEERGIIKPIYFESLYVRIWFRKTCFIFDTKEGFKN